MNSVLPASPVCFLIRAFDAGNIFRHVRSSGNGVAVRRLRSFRWMTLKPMWCFVLMSIAGVALPPSGVAVADESARRAALPGRPEQSESEISASAADNSAAATGAATAVAGSASSQVRRLPENAGARGWIGPHAHYYVAPVIRKSHSAYDGPAIPPPAPPSDLPPLPKSPDGQNDAEDVTDSQAPRQIRTLTSNLQIRTVDHQKAGGDKSRLTQLLQNARQADSAPAAFQLESPARINRLASATRAAVQETTSAYSSSSEKRENDTTDDSSLNLTESVREALASSAASGIQSLSRPLNQVSLGDAQRLESLSGDDLRAPEDKAAAMFSRIPQQFEFPRGFGVPRPARNARQLIHNPLYFEDPNMERCGIGYGCLTEVASAVRFFGRVPVMPYLMASNPPNSCVRTLGDCPACHAFGLDAYLPPPDVHASAIQAACTVGLIFLIP